MNYVIQALGGLCILIAILTVALPLPGTAELSETQKGAWRMQNLSVAWFLVSFGIMQALFPDALPVVVLGRFLFAALSGLMAIRALGELLWVKGSSGRVALGILSLLMSIAYLVLLIRVGS